MDNHYHVVVETVEGNLALGMRHLNGVYTQTFNHAHHRVGHVFQGRYKAVIVEKDCYLLELARYVVLNPLRAYMVSDVAAWPWRSYAAMTGTQAAPVCLQTDWILGQFANQRLRAIALYVDFVRADVGLPSVWEQLSGQVFLGSESFIKRLQPALERSAIGEIPRVQRRPLAKPLSHYQSLHGDA